MTSGKVLEAVHPASHQNCVRLSILCNIADSTTDSILCTDRITMHDPLCHHNS